MAIADIATPTSHGRCRRLLFKEAVGDLNAVESQGNDVEEQGPGACRAKHWQTLELTKRLVDCRAANARIVRKLQPGEYWLSVRHKDGNANGAYSVGATTRA